VVHASEPFRSRACTRPTQRPSSPQLELYQFATKSPLGHAVMVGSWLCPEKGSSRPSPGHLTYRRMTGGMGSSDHLGQRAPLGGGVYPGARIGGGLLAGVRSPDPLPVRLLRAQRDAEADHPAAIVGQRTVSVRRAQIVRVCTVGPAACYLLRTTSL
jgi:hypothetical protein